MDCMNKRELSKMQHRRVRVFPIARRFDERRGVELEQIDDVWLVTAASREALVLRNPRSHEQVELGTDHVREFMTDAGRSDGVLLLKSQIILHACHIPRIEPLHPMARP
jgi:hypothetical protein